MNVINIFCYLLAETLFTNVLCGITAGVVSSSLANPTDVLKVSTVVLLHC